MRASTAIVQDTRRPKKDGTFPIKLRVTLDREQKYYTTPLSLTIEDFEKTQGARPRNEFKDISLRLQAIESKAAGIVQQLPLFTWLTFEKFFLGNTAAGSSLTDAFTQYAKELRTEGRIGTAVSYECARSSLHKFSPNTKLADITAEFLRRYEKWMVGNGNSITTVGIYLRSLRTIINNAIAEGSLRKELYPFGRKKYEIPLANNVKKALSLKDIAAIYYHQPEAGTYGDMSKDYWIFMYLCNGINVKDMTLLKYGNIKGEVLEFHRAKTARTKRKVEPIRVSLVDDLKEIIKKWGNERIADSTYIFPILGEGLTAERERQLIQQLTGVINDHMRAIARELGIESDCTTYAARHSFATILQRSGVSTEFISEALGHSNVKTTQNYLAGFEDESKKETIKALTAFKNNLQAAG